MKINLSQVITSVIGKPLMKEDPDATIGTRKRILKEILTIKDAIDVTKLRESLFKWQRELRESKEVEMTIKDYFLTLLSQRFELKDTKKESFWVTDLGIACSKGDVLDVSEEQLVFLKRIFENNRVTRTNQIGQNEEKELFFPYELGQILKVLDGQGEPEKETRTTKEK